MEGLQGYLEAYIGKELASLREIQYQRNNAQAYIVGGKIEALEDVLKEIKQYEGKAKGEEE